MNIAFSSKYASLFPLISCQNLPELSGLIRRHDLSGWDQRNPTRSTGQVASCPAGGNGDPGWFDAELSDWCPNFVCGQSRQVVGNLLTASLYRSIFTYAVMYHYGRWDHFGPFFLTAWITKTYLYRACFACTNMVQNPVIAKFCSCLKSGLLSLLKYRR